MTRFFSAQRLLCPQGRHVEITVAMLLISVFRAFFLDQDLPRNNLFKNLHGLIMFLAYCINICAGRNNVII